MLAETVTRLEMSWKKLLRAEKGAEADREKSSEKGTGRETDRGKNEMEEQGREGWQGRWESEVAAAYVICGEKTELKARYHLSSGK